jgi:flagellar FliJ protein
MKRYRFRLDSVLRVRRIEKDEAAAQLGEAQRAALAAEEARLAAERRHLERAHQGDPKSTTAVFLAHRALTQASAASVIVSRRRAEAADAAVDARRDDWTEAAGKVSGLERLDERARDLHRAEEQRAEAIEVDDLVTRRHHPQGGGQPVIGRSGEASDAVDVTDIVEETPS